MSEQDQRGEPLAGEVPKSDYLERLVTSRARLMGRFKAQIESSPAMSDAAPQGSGPPNRHGMPQLPVGQVETKKWPVLDLGVKPFVSLEAWRLVIDGAVQSPCELDWEALMSLEQVEDVSDLHCVTTWSKFDMRWRGVRLSTLLALALAQEPGPSSRADSGEWRPPVLLVQPALPPVPTGPEPVRVTLLLVIDEFFFLLNRR